MITSLSQLNFEAHYTYSDYLIWKFQERVELLKGKISLMAAPSVKHQRVSGYLHILLGNHLKHNKCDVFSAPFDVRLPLPTHRITDNKIDTVVQPDLCVICDQSKLDERGCIGAPELIIEILSLGNSKKEMKAKFDLYENAGVQEYWVIDPEHNLAFCYYLDEKTHKYIPSLAFTDDEVIESKVLEGLTLNLEDLFRNK
jgi:Uma2 family endonuclease